MKTPILIVTATWLGIALPAQAQQQAAPPSEISSVNREQAAVKAREQVDGRVLKVEPTAKSYRVKMLKKSGRVVSVEVDKKSGQVRTSQQKEKR